MTLVSRDVIFHKNIFPYEGQQTDPISCSLPLPTHDPNEIIDDDSNISTSIYEKQNLEKQPIATDIIPTEPRRSTRTTSKPTWLDDFICSYSSTHSPPIISAIALAYAAFAASVSKLQEPRSYNQAAGQAEWVSAMHVEIQALENNKTWDIMPLPKDKRAIGCRWIYKLKLRPDGTIDRHKARLVAKGYNQIEGVDYFESFSPVAKVVTVRALLAVAASACWFIHQLDVNNAFLHGYLDEEIYMETLEGYQVPPGHVCRLQKSLYGLKQASRQWNCPSEEQITEVKCYLDELFTIKDLGPVKYFVGLEIARASEGLALTQGKYIGDILNDMGLQDAKTTTTPLPAGIKFTTQSDNVLPHPAVYRRLVGRLLYLNFTRPDIAHATQQLSQFLQTPCQQHWDAAVHLVKYLEGTKQK
ncbi:UNVERIFIED_CONTAM: Retrovirus-related Pol polyprotein from transposon RE2 [Sesamum radiatum]|uniref:Retrovirus-related Pol polyprotein from transposon RE2 n=1 Tax=Sesamum radiatum TaxID=300843 RepID=A0AAW2WJ24_SESRA